MPLMRLAYASSATFEAEPVKRGIEPLVARILMESRRKNAKQQMVGGLYTGDVDVQAVTVRLLAFAALFQIADVIQVTCISALRGYKDTRIPMFIMLFSFWGISLPLGYVLTFSDMIRPAMGAAGFWVGLTAGLMSASSLLGWRLLRFVPEDHPHK